VRDVESALNAYLQKRIDHRVISVVMMEKEEVAAGDEMGNGGARLRPPVEAGVGAADAPREEMRAEERSPATPVVEFETPPAAPLPRPAAAGRRVRFVSANLLVSGLRTQAQVELTWRGATRLGSATGPSARENAERLVAAATLQALQPFLGEERSLAVQDVTRVRMGRRAVVVVAVKLLEQRSERMLTGSCTLEHDLPQTVVFATLSAVNRILGGLPVREPVEYELRPASA
jgi:hypothetical protein